jgi:FkbM family methyltransferase
MSFITRVKRAARELLGLHQWPKGVSPQPVDFEQQLYQALIREGDFVLDIGAHVGDVSIFLARLIGPGGRVVAFEPVWPVFERLCRKLQKDPYDRGLVIPISSGVAECEKVSDIQVPDEKFGLASLAPAANWERVQHAAKLKSYVCSFVSVDLFLQGRHLPVPDFIKIDVEGAEKFVLQGAGRLLAGDCRPLIVVEIFAPWEQAFGYGPWEVLQLLASYGYEFLFACPEGLVEHVPTGKQPFPVAFVNGYNVIAFSRTRHAERIKSVAELRAGHGGGILPMAPAPQPNQPLDVLDAKF